METSTGLVDYHLKVVWVEDFKKSRLQEGRVEEEGF
jgi:hypothetical protein